MMPAGVIAGRKLAAALLSELLIRELPIPFPAAIAIDELTRRLSDPEAVSHVCLESALFLRAHNELVALKKTEGTERLSGAIAMLRILGHTCCDTSWVVAAVNKWHRDLERAARATMEQAAWEAAATARAYAAQVRGQLKPVWGERQRPMPRYVADRLKR